MITVFNPEHNSNPIPVTESPITAEDSCGHCENALLLISLTPPEITTHTASFLYSSLPSNSSKLVMVRVEVEVLNVSNACEKNITIKIRFNALFCLYFRFSL